MFLLRLQLNGAYLEPLFFHTFTLSVKGMSRHTETAMVIVNLIGISEPITPDKWPHAFAGVARWKEA